MIARLARACVTAAAVVCIHPTGAEAQSLPSGQSSVPVERHALLVLGAGENSAAPSAAVELTELLRDTYGFSVDRLVASDASREAITSRVRRLASSTRRQDLTFVMLALPVQVIGMSSFIVPVDGNREQPWTLLLPEEVLGAFSESPRQSIFLILPACRETSRFEQSANASASIPNAAPPGASLVTYCPTPNGTDVVIATLLDILRRGPSAGRVTASAVASAFNAALPSAGVDLQIGLAAWQRPFVFESIRGRLSIDFGALRRPTPDDIDRAIKNTSMGPSSTRADDIANLSGALGRVVADSSQSPESRTRAVRGLGELGSRASLQTLDRISSDRNTDPLLRREAIEAIARIGTADAVPIVRSQLHDANPPVREAAVRATAALQDRTSVSTLATLVRNDAVTSVRIAAVQALALLGAPNEGRPALVAALRDVSPDVRREAASALGSLRANAAAELLSAYPQERVADVQQALIYAVARVPHNAAQTSTIEDMFASAARSAAPAVREAAIFSLGSFGTPRAHTLVRTGLADDNDRVRAAAIQSAGRQRNADAVEPLLQFLTDVRPDVRAAAVESLGRIGDRRAVVPLVDVLKNDEDEYVQESAKRWLAGLRVNEELLEALHDPSPPIRLRAIQTISASAAPPPIAALVEALGDGDYEVRSAAVAVLSRTATDADVAAIVQALEGGSVVRQVSALAVVGNLAERQPPPNLTDVVGPVDGLLNKSYSGTVRAEAVRAAGRLGGPQWLEPIVAAAKADDGAVRKAAADSLGRYDSPDAIAALKRLATDPMADVQQAAFDSLRRLNVK